MRKLSLICLFLSMPLWAADAFLQWMDQIAQRQLSEREAAVKQIRTVEGAEERQQEVRAKILKLIGGLPDYDGPLNARVTGRLQRPRYTIEKVLFESLPEVWVSADLYRPNDAGRHPGVLFAMGHWEEGKVAAQRTAANLAMKGFVVLAFDPVGQGERQQAYDARMRHSLAGGSTEQHFLSGAQSILAGENFARYRIWDAKRALDYLVSRPEVETSKIGCTGCSGGGTLTTYISALDARITVAAPACYINTFRLLFTGPTGDSEQSFPNFLSSGLDIPDYIELFAPKPWLISSTVSDFFPIEGARHAYQEALDWYRIFGAEEKIRWAIGPGGHGTPLEIREAIYQWMIRWLKDGKGNFREEAVEMAPDFELLATESGQVPGRDLYQVIAEHLQKNMHPGSPEELVAELRRLAQAPSGPPSVRVVDQQPGADFRTEKLAIETEPGLEIAGTLYLPVAAGRKVAVLLVDGSPAQAADLARKGDVVLNLLPRGMPEPESPTLRLSGNATQNTRAWLIGRNLPGMRAADIVRGAELLAARPDVASVRGAARGVSGMWLLMAAAIEPKIQAVWIDKTPYSLRAAIREPLSRNLHDAVIPGFALRWDLEDMVKAMGARRVIWSDPTDWMGKVAPHIQGARYRALGEPDQPFLTELMR